MQKLDGQGVLAVEQPTPGPVPFSPPQQQQPVGAAPAAAAGDLASAAVADVASATADSPAAPLVVLLYGAPLAGTSTQAALLGSRYGVPVVTVDSLLQEAHSLQQAQVAATAAAAAAAGSPLSPGKGPQRQLADGLSKLLFGIEDLGPPLSPTGRTQSAASSHSSSSVHADAQHQLSVPDVITAALRSALQQQQYSKGYIVDGLNSRHAVSAAVVARCVLLAAGLTCKALQHPEPPSPPAAAASVRGSKTAASRPPSSRPGKGAAIPEPVSPLMTFTGPDVWEGSHLVSVLH